MNKISAIAIVFAILAWVISMNIAYAYNPNRGVEEQDARMYEQQNIERYHQEDMNSMQTQIDELRDRIQEYEGY